MPRALSDDVAANVAEPTGTRPVLVVSVYWSVDEATHYAAEPLTDPVTAEPKLLTIGNVTDRTGFERTAESTEWSFELIDDDLTIRDLIAAASAIGPLGRRVLFRLTFPGTLWDDAATLFDGFLDRAVFDATQRTWRLEAVGWDKAIDAEFLPTVSARSFPKLPIDDCRASRAVLPLVIGDPVYRVPAVLIARPGFGRLGTELRLWHQNLYLHADAGDLGFPLDGEVSLAVGWPGNYEIFTGGFVGSEDDDTEAEDFEPRKRFVIRSRTRVWASGTQLATGGSGALKFISVPLADLPSTATADVIGRVVWFRDNYQNATTGSGAITWRQLVATVVFRGSSYMILSYAADLVQKHWRYEYVIGDPQGLDTIWPAGTPVTQVHPGTLTNPFETLDGDTAVTVNWASHGLIAGDVVRFASSQDVGGLRITGVFSVTSVNSIDQFVITTTVAATSDASGGGTVNYWTRPEAGHNNYWKYCIAAHPVTSVERLEARGQISPPGGGATQPVWFTLSDAEYDVQLDDRSHNEGLGRVPVGDDDLPEGDPGIATVSLARPLSAYGSFDSVPFATMKGPIVVGTDTDPPTIAKKPCDVLDAIMRGPLSFLDPDTQIDADALAAVQESLDDEEGGSVELGFAITEQSKFIETLKRIAVQAGLTLAMPGGVATVARIQSFDATPDDVTLGLSTVQRWAEAEHDPGPSRVVANVPQYAAGDPVRVESVSADQEAAFERREESLDLWAYNSRINAQRAAKFWHQHLLDRQRAVTCNRYLDGLKHYVADQLGGTLDSVTLPGQVREMMVSLTESPQIGLTLEARRFIWDDVETTLTDDRRCFEPPSDIWIPNAPQAFLMAQGQGETPFPTYELPTTGCYCRFSTEGFVLTISGLTSPYEDLNGRYLFECRGSDQFQRKVIVNGTERTLYVFLLTAGWLVRLDTTIYWEHDYFTTGNKPPGCADVSPAFDLYHGDLPVTPGTSQSAVTLEVLGCSTHSSLPSVSRLAIDITGYVWGSGPLGWYSRIAFDAGPVLFRYGFVNADEDWLPIPGGVAPTTWQGQIQSLLGANTWVILPLAVMRGDNGKLYVVVISVFNGFTYEVEEVAAVYEADMIDAAIGSTVSGSLVFRDATQDPGSTYPATCTLTVVACRTLIDAVQEWDE